MSQNSEKRMTVLHSHFFYSFFLFFVSFFSQIDHTHEKGCCVKRCVYIVRKKYEHTSIEKESLDKDKS